MTIEEKEGVLWMEFPEELTIQHVGDLKEAFKQAIEKELPLMIRASRLKNTHTAIIQLMLTWKKSGRKLDCMDPSPEFKKFLERLAIKAE